MSAEHQRRFELFGSSVRVHIGTPVAEPFPAAAAAIETEAFLRGVHRDLSRFDPVSELSALNTNPAETCEVSPLLAAAVEAGLRAARLTGGLVDPTLVDQIERAGYAESRVGAASAPLREALDSAPPREPALPRADAAWRSVSVDSARSVVRRPPGVRLDTGGTGKGLAADLAAARLSRYATHAVDVGGDIRIGGARPTPRRVEVNHPLRAAPAHVFELAEGAVATSGIGTRIWRRGDGFAHHLLDPSTGRSAWTGVIQVTAVASTAVEAEAIAKAALLSGPERCGVFLGEQGGVAVLDDGEVLVFAPCALVEAAA